MAPGHARRSRDGDVEPPREETAPAPPPAADVGPEAALDLQRAYGNRAVQRMLAAAGPRLLQRQYDPEFTFGPGNGTIERTKISTQEQLNEELELVIDDRFGGYRSVFQHNAIAKTPDQWADLVHQYMEEAYILDGLERADVLEAVRWVKDKHRAETLLHMANVHVYWQDEGPPWSLQNLEDRMVAAGAFIESPQDDDALRAIFATGGASAQTKIEVAPGNLELSDEQGIVVLMDDHQNKHQRDKIAQFKPYTGEPGTKFAVGKDLDWHRDNTVPVVRETVREAMRTGRAKPGVAYSPSKDAIDGIIYDLTITYDEATGKYVGTYHCNPVKNE